MTQPEQRGHCQEPLRPGTPWPDCEPTGLAAHPQPDRWHALAAFTPARIALGRTGGSLPTDQVLAFALAHAQARDAVHAALDAAPVAAAVAALGFATVQVESAAPDRASYLRRPDWGRLLSARSRAALSAAPCDLAFVIADGLSATAVHRHAVPLLAALQPWIAQAGWTVGPVAIAHQARVALGDEVGARIGARLMVLLIGERPGLSSPDSLGAYLTYAPQPGRTDAERNCVSNIRPEGLSYDLAAFKLAWLARHALHHALTGVALKDTSVPLLPPGTRPPAALARAP
jgi:ethanolamine ammonia-lyase small subunit